MSTQVHGAHDSVQAFLGDASLMSALKLYAAHGILENMATERFLALLRSSSAVSFGVPTAERVRTAGYMTQLLQAHKAAGGRDPRKLTRRQLLELDVPLRAASRSLTTTTTASMRRAAVQYAWAKFKEHKAEHGAVSRCEMLALRKHYMASFKDLPEAERLEFGVADDDALPATLNDDGDAEPPVMTAAHHYDIQLDDRLWGLSSVDEPVRPCEIEQEIKNVRGDFSNDPYLSNCGLRNETLNKLRSDFVKSGYITHPGRSTFID